MNGFKRIYKAVEFIFNKNPKFTTYQYGDIKVSLMHNPLYDEQ